MLAKLTVGVNQDGKLDLLMEGYPREDLEEVMDGWREDYPLTPNLLALRDVAADGMNEIMDRLESIL